MNAGGGHLSQNLLILHKNWPKLWNLIKQGSKEGKRKIWKLAINFRILVPPNAQFNIIREKSNRKLWWISGVKRWWASQQPSLVLLFFSWNESKMAKCTFFFSFSAKSQEGSVIIRKAFRRNNRHRDPCRGAMIKKFESQTITVIESSISQCSINHSIH